MSFVLQLSAFTDLSDVLCLTAVTSLCLTNFKFTALCLEMEKLFGSFHNVRVCTNKLLQLILPNQNTTPYTSIIWQQHILVKFFENNFSGSGYAFVIDCIVSCTDERLKKG
jgi:hypothetical protein